MGEGRNSAPFYRRWEGERELETVGRFKAPLMAFINGGNGSIELQLRTYGAGFVGWSSMCMAFGVAASRLVARLEQGRGRGCVGRCAGHGRRGRAASGQGAGARCTVRAVRAPGGCARLLGSVRGWRGGLAAGAFGVQDWEGEAQGAGGGARLGGRRQRRRLLCKETGARG